MMKLCVSVFFALLGLVSVGCSIDRRSSEFRCINQSDCSMGRICDQGWCVTGGVVTPSVDAMVSLPDARPQSAPDARFCAPQCSSCLDGTCIISCTESEDCPDKVTCPPGVPCEVQCTGTGSCMGGIDCSAASACEIRCNADGACAGPISCGTGRCAIDCSASNVCTGGIDCSLSCQCQMSCGANSCIPAASCPGNGACQNDNLCRSSNAQCNTCTL